MIKPDQINLNLSFLKNRVRDLGFKQWWLAEQIGVDRKTVSRWLNGLVRSIQIENAEKLAQILSCKIEDLALPSEQEALATVEDQRVAAQAVANSSLVDKLGPIGEWNVIESLLKATIVPNLPLHVLGDLYNQLCVASWRQSKIDQASVYNKKAKDIALRLKDNRLLVDALMSEANIFSWKGLSHQAIESYKKALNFEPIISLQTSGALYSNLGAVLYETGHLNEGQKSIEQSIELFLIEGSSMNLSVAYTHLAIIELEKNNINLSRVHIMKSTDYAQASDYRRGLAMNNLILSEVEARLDHHEESEKLLKKSLQDFESLEISEGLNFKFAGRICRILNQKQRALELLKKGIAISFDFPLEQAALYQELGQTERAMGIDPRDSFSKSMDLFERCQASLKAIEVKNMMNSTDESHVP